MAEEVLFLAEDAVEGGYSARALCHSIFAEADLWEELKRAIRDAVQCRFEEGKQPHAAHGSDRYGRTCRYLTSNAAGRVRRLVGFRVGLKSSRLFVVLPLVVPFP